MNVSGLKVSKADQILVNAYVEVFNSKSRASAQNHHMVVTTAAGLYSRTKDRWRMPNPMTEVH